MADHYNCPCSIMTNNDCKGLGNVPSWNVTPVPSQLLYPALLAIGAVNAKHMKSFENESSHTHSHRAAMESTLHGLPILPRDSPVRRTSVPACLISHQ